MKGKTCQRDEIDLYIFILWIRYEGYLKSMV